MWQMESVNSNGGCALWLHIHVLHSCGNKWGGGVEKSHVSCWGSSACTDDQDGLCFCLLSACIRNAFIWFMQVSHFSCQTEEECLGRSCEQAWKRAFTGHSFQEHQHREACTQCLSTHMLLRSLRLTQSHEAVTGILAGLTEALPLTRTHTALTAGHVGTPPTSPLLLLSGVDFMAKQFGICTHFP